MRYLTIFLFLFSSLYAEVPPLKVIAHPVTTSNPEAQVHFNMGVTNLFAFNHDLAFHAFEKALQLDPQLAMAYWGMAMAKGQNVNEDVTRENELKCYGYMEKARALASNASPNEQAYIEALSTRYTNDPDADLIPYRSYYREAMKKVAESYPEDLDASTFYAESILNLTPWKWWSREGKAEPGTEEAIARLDYVLQRNPWHIGANHFYIHALEESPHPERALLSADRLKTLLLDAGHLLHMPCHIFLLVGEYEKAIETSQRAIAADLDYLAAESIPGNYSLHYTSHNLYVLARAYMLQEDEAHSGHIASLLTQFLKPYFEKMEELAHFAYVPLEILLHFHRWQQILDYQLLTTNPVAVAYSHFARAVAFASLNQKKRAEEERSKMIEVKNTIPSSKEVAQNSFHAILDLADVMISAKLADDPLPWLEKGVDLQECLFYDEPPAFFDPVRGMLGAALLQKERFDDAAVQFRKGLEKFRLNGRLLVGLQMALEGQGRPLEAWWVEREKIHALQHATHSLSLTDLLW